MGEFRVELTGVGAHGCQREVKDGGTVYGCARMDCPDCVTAEYVGRMAKHAGVTVVSAKITHWPGQPNEVVDNFVTEGIYGGGILVKRVRTGSF